MSGELQGSREGLKWQAGQCGAGIPACPRPPAQTGMSAPPWGAVIATRRRPSPPVGSSGDLEDEDEDEDDWSGLMHFCRSRFRIRQSPRRSSTIAAISGFDVMTTKTALIARTALLASCHGGCTANLDQVAAMLAECVAQKAGKGARLPTANGGDS